MPLRCDVEVWRIDLRTAPAPDEEALALLPPDERARHAAFLQPAPAKAFALARIGLRRLLARRLGCAPRDIPIVSDARGKPVVADAAHCFFNVSHTDACVLLALSDEAEVGVDIEHESAMAEARHLRPHICSLAEHAWLVVRESDADAALARLWARKEAVLKAWGTGLARPMSSLDLGDLQATAGLVEIPGDVPAAWRDLVIVPGEAAAVAAAAHGVQGVRVIDRGDAP